LLLVFTAAASGPPPEGDPGPRWHEGPVRYLLSAEEEREVRSLRARAEIEAFVERFWLRRDPTPHTPANEFQDEFRRRLQGTNRRFTETSKPGWKTDQGKIYILLGPPDETISSGLEASRRSVIVWVYRNPPQPDLGPQVAVRFVQDSSGEYRLSADAFADSRVLLLGSRNLPGLIPGPPSSGEGSDLYDQIQTSRLQDVPVAIHSPQVSVRWSAIGQPFASCPGYYLSEDGSTLATLTLEVDPTFLREGFEFRSEELHALANLARLGGGERIDLGEMAPLSPVPEASTPGPLRFQAMRVLRPGSYRAYFALVDGRDSLRASYHLDLEVPQIPTNRLALSSLGLVGELGEARAPGREPKLQPFVIGHLRVVPRCRPQFAAGEELQLYYQIYDGPAAAGAEAPALDIEYRFEYLLDGARYPIGEPLRLPGRTSRVQGQTFRLQGWLPGRYRLSLSVTDPGGRRAAGELAFEIR
jgi:GWxTD domain-containing protein